MNRDKDTGSALKGENNEVAADRALSHFPKASGTNKSPCRMQEGVGKTGRSPCGRKEMAAEREGLAQSIFLGKGPLPV